MENTVRVLIVDDHRLVRQSLRFVLGVGADVQVIGEADNGVDALRLCAQLNPDIVLMDLHLPGINGVRTTRLIRERFPKIRVIAMSVVAIGNIIAQAALQAGASRYLDKQVTSQTLLDAIREVMQSSAQAIPIPISASADS